MHGPPENVGRVMAAERRFSFDWFSENVPRWTEWFDGLKGQPDLSVLEVGCFEGQATCWLLDHVLTGRNSRITVVDSFQGGHDHAAHGISFAQTEATFRANIAMHASRVDVIKGLSQEVLRRLAGPFDVVYIDGSHVAADVLEDAVLGFRLLKPGGLLIFDDYEWDAYPDPALNPRLAIDAFLEVYRGHYELVGRGYQVAIRKNLAPA